MVRITLETHGLIRTISGIATKEEMDASALSIQGNPRLDEMRYNIHDFTALVELNLDETDIEIFAARANVAVKNNPRLKIAFVGQHKIAHQLMNAFNNTGYSSNKVLRFDTLDEARAYACR